MNAQREAENAVAELRAARKQILKELSPEVLKLIPEVLAARSRRCPIEKEMRAPSDQDFSNFSKDRNVRICPVADLTK